MDVLEILVQIWIRGRDEAQAKERAGKCTHQGDGLEGYLDQVRGEDPHGVREPLDAAVDHHREDAEGEVLPHWPGLYWLPVPQYAVDQPCQEHKSIDGDIALAERRFVARVSITNEAPQGVHFGRVDRCGEWVGKLRAEKEPRPEWVLVAQWPVERVDHPCRPRHPKFEEDRRQERPSDEERCQYIEHCQPVACQPKDASIQLVGPHTLLWRDGRLYLLLLRAFLEATLCLVQDGLRIRCAVVYIPRFHPIPRCSSHRPMALKLSVIKMMPTRTRMTPAIFWMVGR